jgi:hypothetical protein
MSFEREKQSEIGTIQSWKFHVKFFIANWKSYCCSPCIYRMINTKGTLPFIINGKSKHQKLITKRNFVEWINNENFQIRN